MTDALRHETIDTASGIRFHIFDPKLSEVKIEDIAHALALKCRFAGHSKKFYCPIMDHKILTSSLSWVRAGDIKVGEALLAFDEYATDMGSAGTRRRRIRKAIVQESVPIKRNTIRLEMSDGSTVCTSEEHPWLIATKQSRNQTWRTASQILEDLSLGRRRYIHKFIDPWETNTSHDGGWLARIFDEEGYLSVKNRAGTQIGASQKPGIIVDEIKRVLDQNKFSNRACKTGSVGNDVLTIIVKGGWTEVLRFLGSIRPIRLLSKFDKYLNSGEFYKQIGGKEPLEIIKSYKEGKKWCAGIQTSTRTYLCEGFGAHNSIGQHCVYVSDKLEQFGSVVQLAGLLHDAAEAYLADLPGPLKRGLPSFKTLEDKVLAVIGNKFKIPFDVIESPDVKRADHFMLAWEYRDLMASGPKMLWFKEKILSVSPESLPCMTLVPCSWEVAEENYLTTFKRLHKKISGHGRTRSL